MGAASMAAICEELETAGRDSNMTGAEILLNDLKNEFEKVRREMDRLAPET